MFIVTRGNPRLSPLNQPCFLYIKGREICCFGLLKKKPKGLTDAFYGYEKAKKSFWFCNLFIF